MINRANGTRGNSPNENWNRANNLAPDFSPGYLLLMPYQIIPINLNFVLTHLIGCLIVKCVFPWIFYAIKTRTNNS